MKIAMIAAMPEEFRAVAKGLGKLKVERLADHNSALASLNKHSIRLIESGMGFKNATRATEVAVLEFAPDLLISIGFCGAIAPSLQVGDLVLAERVLALSAGGVEVLALKQSALAAKLLEYLKSGKTRAFGGSFAATAAITSKAEVAARLAGRYPCPVVEMETAAIARIAAQRDIPLLAIRSVSDPADEELGFSLEEFCDSNLRIRPEKVLLTILRKPRIIPQLVRLAGNSRIAANSLTTAVRGLLPLLG